VLDQVFVEQVHAALRHKFLFIPKYEKAVAAFEAICAIMVALQNQDVATAVEHTTRLLSTLS